MFLVKILFEVECQVCGGKIKKGKKAFLWDNGRYVHKRCQPYPAKFK